MPRVLILHLGNSGHHTAARAIEAALRALNPAVRTLCVDPIAYAHPYFSKLIHHTYLGLLRGTPELWDVMYDSVRLDRLTRRIRWLTHRGQSRAYVGMLADFRPDAVVCTQAYSFGVMAAYQKAYGARFPLFGVTTDYRPHRFWVQDGASTLVVPDEDAARRLASLGVARQRIKVYGIPVSPQFAVGPGSSAPPAGRPRVLVMGGSLGLGARYSTLRQLDRATGDFAIDVVAGTNVRLRRHLLRRRAGFAHPLRVRGYVQDVHALMHRASLLISKPGGLTSAEAMVAGLPMIVVRPLPGQESGNLEKLVSRGAAVHLKSDDELPATVDTLLSDPERLARMQANARALGKPAAVRDIAREILAATG